MKRKTYMDPTTRVVKLQHRTHLLVGSDNTSSVGADRSDYGEANDGKGIWIWD